MIAITTSSSINVKALLCNGSIRVLLENVRHLVLSYYHMTLSRPPQAFEHLKSTKTMVLISFVDCFDKIYFEVCQGFREAWRDAATSAYSGRTSRKGEKPWV